jgi:hypothetical protein
MGTGKNMRRRLEIFIPIVLLSIMVQLMAPIGAFRAVAYAVSDPLHMAAICSGMMSSQDASQTDPANPQHRANCCAFCGVGHQRQYQLITWLEATDHLPPARVGSHAQARAPPAIS